MTKNLKLIFLGAPGAGKGTQSDIVAEKYGIPTISTGVMIREAIKNGTEMGLAAKSYTEKGALVPDEVVIGIIGERLAKDDCQNGFILDGFPRTVPQAEALDTMGVDINCVVSIEVEDEKIVERMSGRRVCAKCGASYHTLYNPSKDGESCDKCGEALSIRKDDAPEVVKSRLVVYHDQTEPLKDFYGKKGVLALVEGQEKVEDTTALMLSSAINYKNLYCKNYPHNKQKRLVFRNIREDIYSLAPRGKAVKESCKYKECVKGTHKPCVTSPISSLEKRSCQKQKQKKKCICSVKYDLLKRIA